MQQYKGRLVNWVDGPTEITLSFDRATGNLSASTPGETCSVNQPGEKSSFELQRECRRLAASAQAMEASDIERAIERYIAALEGIRAYAFRVEREGLVGRLVREENKEEGVIGECKILERLVHVLCNRGQGARAREIADEYFSLYRGDRTLGCYTRVLDKIESALNPGRKHKSRSSYVPDLSDWAR